MRGAGIGLGSQDALSVVCAAGYVVGPCCSVDNAIVRFDGTTGQLIQDYNASRQITGSDAGCLATPPDSNVLLGGSLSSTNAVILRHEADVVAADAAYTGASEGTENHQGTAANSLIISNIANNGDILGLVSDCGDSKEWLKVAGATAVLTLGHAMTNVLVPTSGTDGSVAIGSGSVVDGSALALNNTALRTVVTSVGHQLHIPAQTSLFDNPACPTIAVGAEVFIGIPTWNNTAGTETTIIDAATVYIAGDPVGTACNVTLTGAAALQIGAGHVLLPQTTEAATPTFAFGTGTDGLYSGGTGQLNLAAGGQEGIRVLGAGCAITGINFYGDLDFQQAAEISTSACALTLTPSTDVLISDGKGLVVGHTAQIAVCSGTLSELQVLGTGAQGTDSSMLLALWATVNTLAPQFKFLKSGNATIGCNTIVADGERLGQIRWFADDGNDYETLAASIGVEIDGTPNPNTVPSAMIFATSSTGNDDASERMRITPAGCIVHTTGFYRNTATNSITASCSSDQACAVALTTTYNEITVVGTAGDSVRLPAALAGLTINIVNKAANSADVFPAACDTLNGGCANVAEGLATGDITYVASDATDWVSY